MTILFLKAKLQNYFSCHTKQYLRFIFAQGAGSCLEALGENKPIVVVINEDLMNNHQTELAHKLHSDGHLFYSNCRWKTTSSQLSKYKIDMHVHFCVVKKITCSDRYMVYCFSLALSKGVQGGGGGGKSDNEKLYVLHIHILCIIMISNGCRFWSVIHKFWYATQVHTTFYALHQS